MTIRVGPNQANDPQDNYGKNFDAIFGKKEPAVMVLCGFCNGSGEHWMTGAECTICRGKGEYAA